MFESCRAHESTGGASPNRRKRPGSELPSGSYGDSEPCRGRVRARIGGSTHHECSANVEPAPRTWRTRRGNGAVHGVVRRDVVLHAHALRTLRGTHRLGSCPSQRRWRHVELRVGGDEGSDPSFRADAATQSALDMSASRRTLVGSGAVRDREVLRQEVRLHLDALCSVSEGHVKLTLACDQQAARRCKPLAEVPRTGRRPNPKCPVVLFGHASKPGRLPCSGSRKAVTDVYPLRRTGDGIGGHAERRRKRQGARRGGRGRIWVTQESGTRRS